jgi:hypothetical protein
MPMSGCWSRSLIRLLAAAAIVAMVGAGQAARAQDDDEDEEAEPNAAVPIRGAVVFNQAQFDQWLFGNLGTANAGVARNKLDALLTLSVEDLVRTCDLTPFQKKKLLLAGHGDIKRYFDRVEEARKKFQSVKNNQNQLGLMWQDIQQLQTAFQGIFDEGSIFAKSLKSTLKPEQVVAHEKVVRDRLFYRYQARVDLAMEMLNNNVGFTDAQREQLVKLLFEGTRPPKRLGQNDYYAILYLIGTLPEAKVKPIFEDVQYRALKQQLDQARGLGMWLKQNGFIPAGEPAAPPGVARPIRGRVMIPAIRLVPPRPAPARPVPAAPKAAPVERKK